MGIGAAYSRARFFPTPFVLAFLTPIRGSETRPSVHSKKGLSENILHGKLIRVDTRSSKKHWKERITNWFGPRAEWAKGSRGTGHNKLVKYCAPRLDCPRFETVGRCCLQPQKCKCTWSTFPSGLCLCLTEGWPSDIAACLVEWALHQFMAGWCRNHALLSCTPDPLLRTSTTKPP